MATSEKHSSHHKPSIGNGKHAHVKEAASELLNESKKMANELYEDGLHKVNEAQDNVKELSDTLANKVKENPLASVLIAGGIGFLLSTLLKK